MKLEQYICDFCRRRIDSGAFEVKRHYSLGLTAEASMKNNATGPYHYCDTHCLISHASQNFRIAVRPVQRRDGE